MPAAGTPMKFTATTSGATTLRLQVKYNGVYVFDSGGLTKGQTARFTWPGPSSVILIGYGGVSWGAVKAELVAE